MKRVITFSFIALILSSTLITNVFANATDIKGKATAEKTDSGKTLTQTLTIYKNGTVVAGPIENLNNNSKVCGGIEIPQSWNNISTEKHEPREEDLMFLRSSMKDLTEEEKDKLLNEFKEISEGKSKLSKEEQAIVCQKIGHYIIEATEGNVTQPKWTGSPECLETSGIARPKLGALRVLQYIAFGSSYMWKFPEST